MSENTKDLRTISRVTTARKMSHGNGFQASSIGISNLGDAIDPFISLDHFFMSEPTFGPHPHAGFSAVTYMLEDSAGSFLNRDTMGGRELINPGDLHWSQAGSGLMHDEKPTQNGVVCHGIQMFINLSSVNKFSPPQAFHLNAADVPVVNRDDGVRVRVLVGTAFGKKSPLETLTKITFLDVKLLAHTTIIHEVSEEENAFVSILAGSANFDESGTILNANEAGVYARQGSQILVQAKEEPVQYIFGAGIPLGESVLQQGPFIMNDATQMQTVIENYRAGKFGSLEVE
jgi:redox-sensitive bicupin YhaK (pirin superfamily)